MEVDNDEPEPIGDPDIAEKDSSDSDDDAQEEARLIEAEELEEQISANKYLYHKHIQLTEIYRSLGDLKSMRAAYKRFHEVFPLTPMLWLAWIKDEIKVASSATEKKYILSLFEKAAEDYLSVELWVEYVQYCIGASDVQTTREIFEKGLRAVGLHVSQGSLLWDALREFEYAHLSLVTLGSDQWNEQVKKLLDVFKRQLSVPLLNMENTYHEWKDFLKSLPEGYIIDSEAVEWGYHKALKSLETYKPFEEKLHLAKDDNEVYDIYKAYISDVSDPSTKLCLYERAVAAICLNATIWMDYSLFAFSLGQTAVSVIKRALRNMPWSEDLWTLFLRILEHNGEKENVVMECFEQGLASVSQPALELWLTYIEYAIRSCDDKDKLNKLFHQADQQVGHEGDPTSKISRLHARILAKQENMTGARKIWNSIVQRHQNKGETSVWLEYIKLECQYGKPNQVRNTFQRALSACKEWPQYIADEWLLFERENGTLEDVMNCMNKCNTLLKQHKMSYEKVMQESEQNFEGFTTSKSIKRKKVPSEGFDPKGKKRNVDTEKSETCEKKQISRNPKLTVFVSNLHPQVTEEKLKDFFSNAEEVELVTDRKGNSRCYGYIHFTKEDEVMHALARDRESLSGRPVFISQCKPDKNERRSAFKYSEKIESNKLFVRGLPVSKTRADIEEIFRPFGAVEVRLVTHKSGQSKGLAYVEFSDDDSAIKAMTNTNQIKIDGHIISVAISAPPKKRINLSPITKPIRHARSKLDVSFIPRQLQIKNSASNSKNNVFENEAKNSSANDLPKTNDDFRRMLFSK